MRNMISKWRDDRAKLPLRSRPPILSHIVHLTQLLRQPTRQYFKAAHHEDSPGSRSISFVPDLLRSVWPYLSACEDKTTADCTDESPGCHFALFVYVAQSELLLLWRWDASPPTSFQPTSQRPVPGCFERHGRDPQEGGEPE